MYYIPPVPSTCQPEPQELSINNARVMLGHVGMVKSEKDMWSVNGRNYACVYKNEDHNKITTQI